MIADRFGKNMGACQIISVNVKQAITCSVVKRMSLLLLSINLGLIIRISSINVKVRENVT